MRVVPNNALKAEFDGNMEKLLATKFKRGQRAVELLVATNIDNVPGAKLSRWISFSSAWETPISR